MSRPLLLGLVCLAAACSASAPSRAQHDEHDEHAEADHPDSGANHIELDPHVVERNGIRTSPARTHLLLGSLEVPAEIRVNETRVAHIAPLVRGRLQQVDTRLGDQVEAGQVLAEMQSTDLGSLRASLKQAQARKRMAEATLSRKERLRNSGVVAEKDILAAEGALEEASADVQAARAELSVYGARGRGRGAAVSLESPLSGVVLERHAIEGEVVDSATTLFVVADLDKVWVIGSVFERDLTRIAVGLPAEVSVIAVPGRSWRGVVDYVDSALDPVSRTVKIRVELDNADRTLRPGLFGTIAIGERGSEGREVLCVPDGALQDVEGRTVVFIETSPAVFEAVSVVPGARAHGLTEIKDGLDVGAPVVVSGSFALKSKLLEGSLGEGHAH